MSWKWFCYWNRTRLIITTKRSRKSFVDVICKKICVCRVSCFIICILAILSFFLGKYGVLKPSVSTKWVPIDNRLNCQQLLSNLRLSFFRLIAESKRQRKSIFQTIFFSEKNFAKIRGFNTIKYSSNIVKSQTAYFYIFLFSPQYYGILDFCFFCSKDCFLGQGITPHKKCLCLSCLVAKANKKSTPILHFLLVWEFVKGYSNFLMQTIWIERIFQFLYIIFFNYFFGNNSIIVFFQFVACCGFLASAYFMLK